MPSQLANTRSFSMDFSRAITAALYSGWSCGALQDPARLQVKNPDYSVVMLRGESAFILFDVAKQPIDAVLAAEILRRLADAKARLSALMAEHGLRPADGWTILEDLRSRPDYTEYIFRPIHRR